MNRYVPLLVAALFSGTVSAPALAQTVKCLDKSGKITYTNGKCADLGLKDAGEVPDHLNTNPAYKAPPAPLQRGQPIEGPGSGDRPRTRPRNTETEPRGNEAQAPAEPADKQRHCFTVRTPSGGTVTRCNDQPTSEN